MIENNSFHIMSLLTTLQKFPDELETQATNSDYLPEPNKPFLTGTLVTFANSFSSTFTTFQYFAGPRAFSMVFSQFSTPPAQGLCSYLFFFFFWDALSLIYVVPSHLLA